MILTGKAIEFAEGFEKLDASRERPEEDELTEDEQIVLYMINRMFGKDHEFKQAISDFVFLYSRTHKG